MPEPVVEYCVEEADTDGKGTEIGWGGWSTHSTEKEAEDAMWAMPKTEGRLRVARVTTETLCVRDCPSER
jgi:hypothetical protein